MKNLYIDIHALQTLPPNNINRDESGSPKTAIYGGIVRQRVSSQAWKRAIRSDFEESFDAEVLGKRTKNVVTMLANAITAKAPEHADEAQVWAQAALLAAKIKTDAPKKRVAKPKKGEMAPEPEAEQMPVSGYLLFLGVAQANKLADLIISGNGTVAAKDATKVLKADHAVDVALFGRMIADAQDLSVDASAQVAHAISIHEATPEFDYYTAMDDLKRDKGEEAGADMIGTVEFTSSTLYRYATVNINSLHGTLGDADLVAKATAGFVGSFIRSMPTGKQNSFANRTLPDAVVISISHDQPLSWVGAFEEEVHATDGKSRMRVASEVLVQHVKGFDGSYGLKTTRFVSTPNQAAAALAALGSTGSIDDAIGEVDRMVREHLEAAK
ncbi:type I-E CRISPR-associated protein Cas7/Cse4/CasC [Paeniglutamicibacter cryotolerans]|uniref:CRISPR system Cascade subunit CasC n=1 Tax=Paeniglutamicibacter cryotolerans TaxID=670079 RepID=A0A839QPG1_9MICC|nr:type I-E CRISPR-associated protein Cas7/Cse4/CasC [Paeniglutamicibacter cryotolerans]MBB2997493.1 CRISPR system Cascade subunit CasC [Paeniglutamicibacter cryotolerans]